MRCWIAPRDIRGGDRFVEAIVRAIAGCQAFLVVVSEHSAQSQYVLAEVKRAFEAGRKIVPVRLDGTALSAELEFYTNQHQWVEAAGRAPADVLPDLRTALGVAAAGAAEPVAGDGPTLREEPIVLRPSAASPVPRGRRALVVAAVAAAVLAAVALLVWQPWAVAEDVTAPIVALVHRQQYEEAVRRADVLSPADQRRLPADVRAELDTWRGTPEILLEAPREGSWIRGSMLQVTGRVTGFHAADRLRVDLGEANCCDRPVGDGRIDLRAPVEEAGRHRLRARVLRGNDVRAQVDLTIHKHALPPPWWPQPTEAQWAAAARFGLPVAFENPLGMRFVLVPPGKAVLGRAADDPDGFADETPRTVEVPRPFYLQVGEVSNEAYRRFDRMHRSGSLGPIDLAAAELPVVRVRHEDAERFAWWLGVEHDAGHRYRLPTEAEWEYAARAAAEPGSGPEAPLASRVNYGDESVRAVFPAWGLRTLGDDGAARPLARDRLGANALGLRHMLGNVAEWVADRYGSPAAGASTAPLGPARGRLRVVRGGSWGSAPADVRPSSRLGWPPDRADPFIGFRLAADPVLEPGAPR